LSTFFGNNIIGVKSCKGSYSKVSFLLLLSLSLSFYVSICTYLTNPLTTAQICTPPHHELISKDQKPFLTVFNTFIAKSINNNNNKSMDHNEMGPPQKQWQTLHSTPSLA